MKFIFFNSKIWIEQANNWPLDQLILIPIETRDEYLISNPKDTVAEM